MYTVSCMSFWGVSWAMICTVSVGCGPERAIRPPQSTTVPASPPSGEPANAAVATTQGFGKRACSPSPKHDGERQLLVSMPSTQIWGETLFVCGYLRVPPEIARPNPSSSFSVHIRRADGDDFHPDSANFQLGSPELRHQEETYDRLEKEGELYFNAGLFNAYTTLEPGQHDISVRFFDVESERITVSVTPGGWRGEVASLLIDGVCDGTLFEDYAEVLKIDAFLATADMDGPMLAEVQADRQEAAMKAYRRYESQARPAWLEGMRTEVRTDVGVARYAEERVRATCPAKADRANELNNVYQALKGAALSDSD